MILYLISNQIIELLKEKNLPWNHMTLIISWNQFWKIEWISYKCMLTDINSVVWVMKIVEFYSKLIEVKQLHK